MKCPKCKNILTKIIEDRGSHLFDSGPRRPKERMRQQKNIILICAKCGYEINVEGREPI